METDVKKFLNGILEVFFPSEITCFLCGGEVEESKFCLCNKCRKTLPVVNKRCLRCGTPIKSKAKYCLNCKQGERAFALARSPLIYKDEIRTAVRNLKYNNQKHLAKVFAKFMVEEFRKMEAEILPVDVIVPVPMFLQKQKKRGYNQAELLAKEFSKIVNICLDAKSLVRIKDTPTQTALSSLERHKNLENAFKAENNSFKGKVVLLIDDVLTTGSTANSCCKEIKRCGAKEVYVLTFATTELENF